MLPFVTEELYHYLPKKKGKKETICLEPFPKFVQEWNNTDVDEEMATFMKVVRKIRSMIAVLEMSPKERPCVYVKIKNFDGSKKLTQFCQDRRDEIQTLAKVGPVGVITSEEVKGCVHDTLGDKMEVFVEVKCIEDLTHTLQKTKKKVDNTQKQIDTYVKKTKIPDYENKVPLEVRQQNSEKLEQLNEEMKSLSNAHTNIEALISDRNANV